MSHAGIREGGREGGLGGRWEEGSWGEEGGVGGVRSQTMSWLRSKQSYGWVKVFEKSPKTTFGSV